MSNIITLKREVSKEFLSDIMITAFDGQYGASWEWFEPVGRFWLHTEQRKSDDGLTMLGPEHSYWTKALIRLQEDYHTGDSKFDNAEGFIIDHLTLTNAIQRILDDDYLGIWRQANEREIAAWKEGGNSAIRQRKTRLVAGKGLMVETGETARGFRDDLLRIMGGEQDAGDVDAPMADAIVQVAAFGKVIFS